MGYVISPGVNAPSSPPGAAPSRAAIPRMVIVAAMMLPATVALCLFLIRLPSDDSAVEYIDHYREDELQEAWEYARRLPEIDMNPSAVGTPQHQQALERMLGAGVVRIVVWVLADEKVSQAGVKSTHPTTCRPQALAENGWTIYNGSYEETGTGKRIPVFRFKKRTGGTCVDIQVQRKAPELP